MPLMLKVGRKGYIILPKALREACGIKEGDYVVAEARSEGILLKPVKSRDFGEIRRVIWEHFAEISKLETLSPRPGELATVSLEEEFEG